MAHAGRRGERLGLGMSPVPLLHSLTGGAGAWDEIITLALLGGIVVAIAFAILGLRGKDKKGGDD